MNRNTLLNASLALAVLGVAVPAQTTASNPQRPKQRVEEVRKTKDVLRDAAKIDSLLERGLKRKRLEPLPLVDDATFVRRAYLSVVGRIPTLEETESFLEDQATDKRGALLDLLLDSPGRTSHFSNYWFDLLRVKSRQRNLSGEPFAHFIRTSVRDDLPYDEFVRAMVVAEGAAHGRDNGSTGHLMRDTGMPHDSMANTVRLFLGTRLECAQCHNHPFDHWTQKEFFGMAAFFGGISYRDNKQIANYRSMRQKFANEPQATRNAANRLVRRLTTGVHGTGSGIEKLPKDYQYDDARPMSAVKADTIFGANVKLRYPSQTMSRSQSKRAKARRRDQQLPQANSRGALADWMTDKKNPMFAKTAANRMWARTFGRGLVEPIDDWKKKTQAVHPELLKELERLMVRVDFDLRQFERVLLHTKLFQREVEAKDPEPGVAPAFQGPILRRMSAQQVWDSLLTLVFDDLDDRLRDPDARAESVYAYHDQVKDADADEILALVKGGNRNMMRTKAKQERDNAKAAERRSQQARKRARPMLRQLEEARRDGDLQKVAALRKQLEQMGVNLGSRAAKGAERDLLRASDLEQPARLGHVLRQFGQSDRETIDAGSDVATVPQVLTLMNGFLDQRVLNGESALRRDLTLATDGERRVRVAYLTMLNRQPSAQELERWRRLIAVNGRKAIDDLVWVLCNCNEFRFVR
ncbi:MAG: DUF1549 domain-containing protein [Planctomycetota bacterium]|nr:DUF1549 domain-containing protein [Planctomycetota bacterium]MEC9046852.1 DUF1549 domain-containing protein [Planctomycetota bacterium]